MIRARRLFTRIAKVLSSVLLGAFVLVVVSLAVVDTTPGRRLVAERVNRLLATSFKGSIVVEHIGSLGVTGATGLRVRIRDGEGKQVAFADGVETRIRPIALVRSLLSRKDVAIHLFHASIARADVSVDVDRDGALRLLRAFDPPSGPVAAAPSTPSHGVELVLEDAELRDAWVHGRLASGPPLDAEIRDASARIGFSTTAFTVVVSRSALDVRALPGGVDANAKLTGSFTLPSAPTAALHVAAALAGTVGGAPVDAAATLDGNDVSARLDVVDAPPAALGTLGVPFLQPLTLHAVAKGTLPKIAVIGEVRAGTATVHAEGDVQVAPELSGTAHVAVAAVDLHELLAGEPVSQLGGTLDVVASASPGAAPHGTFTVVTAPGRMANNAIPSVRLQGRFDANGANASGALEEPGLPAEFTATLHPHPTGAVLTAHLSAHSDDLRRVRRFALGVSGSGRVDADGTVDLGRSIVAAHVTADVTRVAAAQFDVGRGHVVAVVTGATSAPRFDVRVNADSVRVRSRRFATVTLTARGTPGDARVDASLDGIDDTQKVTVGARVAAGAVTTLHDVHATIARRNASADVTATRVGFGGGAVRVEGLAISGLGKPVHIVLLRVFHGGIAVRGAAEGIELGTVATLVDLPVRPLAGTLGFDADITARGSGAHGHARVDLTRATLGDVRDVEGHLDATLGDRDLDGRVSGVAGGAHFEASAAHVRLGGPLLELESWRSAVGRVELDVDAELSRIKAALPDVILPVNHVSGALTLTVKAERKSGGIPEVVVTARTRKFAVAGLGKRLHDFRGKEVVGPPPWRLHGVDVDSGLSLHEDGKVSVHGRAIDSHGELVRFTAEGTVHDPALWAHPERTTLDRLSRVPLHVSFDVPRRKLADFPAPLQEPGVDGDVELTFEMTDTLRTPKISFSGTASGLRGIQRRRVTPVDVAIRGTYDGAVASVTADVTSKQKSAATLKSTVDLNARAWLDRRTAVDWDAVAHGEFAEFPISALAAVEDQRIDGFVGGTLDATLGTRKKPSLHAALTASSLEIGHAKYAKGSFRADLDDTKLSGDAALTQTDGFVRARGGVGVKWTGPLAPSVDTGSAATASLEARQFRLAALGPFVQDVVDGVDGRLDANVAFEVENGGKVISSKGSIAVTRGKFQFPSFGDEFHDARAKITLEPSGVVKVDDVFAEGGTGRFNASGQARLNGLAVESASGTLDIPKSDPLPISIEGQSIAEAWGKFRMETSAVPNAQRLAITVDVPNATVLLPEKSTHELQDLSEASDVQIGVRTKSGEFMVVPTGPGSGDDSQPASRAIDVLVHVHDVEVRRGTDLRARLEGDPAIHVANKASVSGQIRLREGFLDVEGKRFEIESGTISFVGEPDNPEVVVTAGWTAPEGTRVYADFVGPLQTGKVTLRSDPVHTNTEILSLILFGTTDGNSGSDAPGASSAAGLGGGIATQGLNRALDDLTGLDLTTRIDTSDSASPRPELEVRVARDITVSIAHVLGVPPPGTDPDLNFATLDWRFLRNWSVETTFGDAGSSILDMVWQYRY